MGRNLLSMQLAVVDQQETGVFNWSSTLLYQQLYWACIFTLWYIPWVCDCALLCKLLSFHPAVSTTSRKRAAIMAFPLAMHIPRVPLLVASSVFFTTRPMDWNGVSPLIAHHTLVAEGALQVAQNCYCSGFLLYKAHQFARADYAASNQQAQRARLGLRYFIESVLFTFLPASVLQAAWLLAVTAWQPEPDGRQARADSYLRMFNVMFSVNFGLLAVWWASARIHAQEVGESHSQLGPGVTKQQSAQDMSMLDWALGPIQSEDSQETNALTRRQSHRSSLADELLSLDEDQTEVEEKKS